MNAYTIFLYAIVLAKVMYSLSVLLQFTELLGWDYFSNEFYEKNKERFEHLYILMMSSLVIYIFRNRAKGTYKFTRFEAELFFVFGIILISQLFTNWLKSYVQVNDDKDEDEKESDVVEVTTDFIIPAFK